MIFKTRNAIFFLIGFFLFGQASANAWSLFSECWTETCRERIASKERWAEYLAQNKIGVLENYIYEDEQKQHDLLNFRVVIVVDRAASTPTAQTAKIYLQGELIREMSVSTGLEDYKYNPQQKREIFADTRDGRFLPQRLVEDHVSGSWGEPMPHSVFYDGGWALHGIQDVREIRKLGQRASAGCVRFGPKDAKVVFDLVKAARYETLIVVHNTDFF